MNEEKNVNGTGSSGLAENASADGAQAEKEKSMEQILAELDRVLETLGESETTLEQSFELYKEGMTLLKDGTAKIDRVEKKMLELDKEGELHEFFGGTE